MPFIFGIILAYYFQTTQLLRVVTYLLAIQLLIAATVNLYYKKLRAWRFKQTLSFFYYSLFAVSGVFICLHNSDQLQPDYFANKKFSQLKIWIASEPQMSGDVARFEAEVTKGYSDDVATNCSGKLLIALKVDSMRPILLKYGDEFLISADYLPVEPPYNPGEFDFKQWLASKNIYHQTFIRQTQLIKTAENKGNSVKAFALELRRQQVDVYRKLIKNDEAFAVASTLILGYRADLTKETLSAYSKTGTIHALSVSGMHVGIIYIALNFLLGFLDRKKSTLLFKVVLICSLIWAYSLLTGFSPSVLRSAIMLTVFILSKQLNRNNNSYNVLALLLLPY
jgi:competence protein ComEC